MNKWVPWALKGLFIALAVVLDRMGMLSPAIANMLLASTLTAGGAAVVSTWVNRPLPSLGALLQTAMGTVKGAAASPAGLLAAAASAEKAIAELKAAVQPATAPQPVSGVQPASSGTGS